MSRIDRIYVSISLKRWIAEYVAMASGMDSDHKQVTMSFRNPKLIKRKKMKQKLYPLKAGNITKFKANIKKFLLDKCKSDGETTTDIIKS